MKVLQAKDCFLDYQKMNAKKKYHEELSGAVFKVLQPIR